MNSIRNLAVGLPVRNGQVLAEMGQGKVKGAKYLRALGGVGETAEAAMRREFKEELGVELGQATLLGVVESIFDFEGSPGHEIVHVFAVESEDIDAMALEAQLHVMDEGSPVGWFDLASLDRPLYPEGSAALVRSWAGLGG